MEKVLVAMSGGVDFSVAAKMLQEHGYECVGCTMRLYNNEDLGGLTEILCPEEELLKKEQNGLY